MSVNYSLREQWFGNVRGDILFSWPPQTHEILRKDSELPPSSIAFALR